MLRFGSRFVLQCSHGKRALVDQRLMRHSTSAHSFFLEKLKFVYLFALEKTELKFVYLQEVPRGEDIRTRKQLRVDIRSRPAEEKTP
jgi:hypothetical protein